MLEILPSTPRQLMLSTVHFVSGPFALLRQTLLSKWFWKHCFCKNVFKINQVDIRSIPYSHLLALAETRIHSVSKYYFSDNICLFNCFLAMTSIASNSHVFLILWRFAVFLNAGVLQNSIVGQTLKFISRKGGLNISYLSLFIFYDTILTSMSGGKSVRQVPMRFRVSNGREKNPLVYDWERKVFGDWSP